MHLTEVGAGDLSTTVYGSHYATQELPRNAMPDEEMPPRAASKFIQDELLMDGNPALNLASFVTTYMISLLFLWQCSHEKLKCRLHEPEAVDIMTSNLTKNFIDVEEYPACGEIESRCVSMVAELFNAPKDPSGKSNAMGVSTIGSSEAIILAVLAAKRRWANARRAAGKSTEKPNIIMNAAVQVCWEKAARYLEVEEKYWYCKSDRFVYDPQEMVDLVDENTVLVVSILGTTYTGQYEDTAKLNDLLLAKNKAEGLDVHIHVDGASGGFVAPFVNPKLVWDFRLPLVCSINASGHKYGLVVAGVGWAVWRSKAFLPDDILFEVNYLGSPQVSFTLNFSKSAIQVLGQYYTFIRYGKNGYRSIMNNLTQTADFLAAELVKFDGGKLFTILSDGEGTGLPLVAWRLTSKQNYDEFAIARTLRERGWIVPAYTMAPNAKDLKLLRVVVREDFSRSRCETFLRDLQAAIDFLSNVPKEAHKAIEQAQDAAKSGDKHQMQQNKHHGHQSNHKGHVHIHDKHSLAGKHGKTHAIC